MDKKNETLLKNVALLSKLTTQEVNMMPQTEAPLPSVEQVKQIVTLVKNIIFPDYFNKRQPDEAIRSYYIGVHMEELQRLLTKQIAHGLQFCEDCECMQTKEDVYREADKLALEFIDALPEIKRVLYTDVQAMFDNDPAAPNYGEVIFCYPVVNTMTHYRIAHKLHELGVPELDTEGRICALELCDLWFVDVYTPNAQQGLARIDHRMSWDDAFRDFCLGLQDGVLPSGESCEAKPVVMCGDFNVAHQEIDLKNPGPNRGNAGFSDEERGKFGELLDAGFRDTWRELHPDLAGVYSWWSYRANARANNAGWRIDYFLVSDALMPRVENADIYCEVMGSDHCPVGLVLGS